MTRGSLMMLVLFLSVTLISSQSVIRTLSYAERNLGLSRSEFNAAADQVAWICFTFGKNGYQSLGFGYNETKPMISYMFYKTPRLTVNRLEPGEFSYHPTHKLINRTDDDLYITHYERDWLTRGFLIYYPDWLFSVVIFNKTNFYKTLGLNPANVTEFNQKYSRLYVHLGVNAVSRPKGPTDFADGYTDAITIMNKNVVANFYYFQTNFRVELLHPAIFAVALTFLLIVFILTNIFCCQYPLKLHGYIPWLSCLYQIISLVSGFPQMVATVRNVADSCYTQNLLVIPIQCSLVTMVPIFLGRNIILWNLNARKSLYVDSKKSDETQKLKLSYRILKFLKNSFVDAAVSFTIAVLFFLLGIIILAIPMTSSYPFKCENIKIYIMTILEYVYIGFVIVLVVILFIVDMVMAIRKAIINGLFFLWKEDVFYLRFQVYILGLGLAAPTFIISSIIIMAANFLDNVPGISLAQIIFNSLTLWSLFIMQTFFVVFVTICKYIYVKVKTLCMFGGKKVKQKDFAYQLLEKKNVELKKIFRTYAESEFSIENLICFEDIQEYKKIKSFKDKQLKGLMIYHTYLNGDASELEINVGRKICQEILSKLQHEPELKADLFEKIEKQVVINLSDTFQRFFLTTEYINYQRTTDFKMTFYE